MSLGNVQRERLNNGDRDGTALVTLAYTLPHFIYHLTKRTLLGPIDQLGELIALGAALIASVVLTASRAGAQTQPPNRAARR
jgi:hypothetical protein